MIIKTIECITIHKLKVVYNLKVQQGTTILIWFHSFRSVILSGTITTITVVNQKLRSLKNWEFMFAWLLQNAMKENKWNVYFHQLANIIAIPWKRNRRIVKAIHELFLAWPVQFWHQAGQMSFVFELLIWFQSYITCVKCVNVFFLILILSTQHISVSEKVR